MPSMDHLSQEEILPLANKALNKAKVQLMLSPDSAFFTTVCLSMKHKMDFSIPTACTDGTCIWFSPYFFMKLTLGQQVFLLLHETMHCAYMHMFRGQGFDHGKFNRAADYVINAQLIERGYVMPEGGLYDEQYKGLGTEQVYKLLPDNPPPPPSGGGGQAGGDASGGSGGLGDFGSDLRSPEDSPGNSKSAKEVEADLSDVLVRAAIQSKVAGDKPGTIPGDIEIFINKLLDPKLPWNRILQKYMNQFSKNDYTFRRPNRRFFPDHYLPSLHSETLEDITIAVDASGSVTDAEFRQFISEVHSILRRLRPKKITLIQFDTRLRHVDEIKSVQDLANLEFHGRGGTVINPVLDWAREHKPALLMVFSDGRFHLGQAPLKKPVLWIIHENPDFEPSFGKVIHYDPD